MSITRHVHGKEVKVSNREMKSLIMKVEGWTEDEYNRERYKMKNRLRTMEAFQRTTDVQSPVEVMYFEARAKQKYGANYTPSFKMQRLKSFAAYGSQKAIQRGFSNQQTMERLTAQYSQSVEERFSAFIRDNKLAQKLARIEDPVERERALSDYADYIQAKQKAQRDELREAANRGGIPVSAGEIIGSDDTDYDGFNWQKFFTAAEVEKIEGEIKAEQKER